MKFKLICTLIVGMCIIGYQKNVETVPAIKTENITNKQTIIAQRHLRIINAVSAVKRGETGVTKQ